MISGSLSVSWPSIHPAWLVISPGIDRNDRALLGDHLVHQVDEVWPRVALHVELDAGANAVQPHGNVAHVVGRDMPLVGAGMHRDPADASIQADVHRIEHPRLVAARELRSVATLLTLTDRRTIRASGFRLG